MEPENIGILYEEINQEDLTQIEEEEGHYDPGALFGLKEMNGVIFESPDDDGTIYEADEEADWALNP